MSPYQVSFVIEADSLDGAYDLAAAANPDRQVTVSSIPDEPKAGNHRWSYHGQGHRVVSSRVEFAIVFDAQKARGKVMIVEGSSADPEVTSCYVEPVTLAEMIRTLVAWPIDLMDAMAMEDLRKRRR